MIYQFNLKEELKEIYLDLLKECDDSRPIKTINDNINYLLSSKHVKKLYKIFIDKCKKNLIFTLKDNDFKCWCYYSDYKFNKTLWHNHINTSTINGVIYLKIPEKNKGIDFKNNNNIINIKPKMFDLLIFPNYLNHYPYPSNNKDTRIVLNLELRCNEESNKIFKNDIK
jgi:hypothetical protein